MDTMTRFDEIVAATQLDQYRCVDQNPLFEIVLGGRMTRAHYVAYLRETAHLVRHTSRALSLAGARLGDERRELRDWFFEQVREENGHDLFCFKDLKNLGEDPEKTIDGLPMAGAWGLVSQNYHMATYGNPIGILGVASATEGLGATVAGRIADYLVETYRIPSNAVSFLRSHAGFDAKHLEAVRDAINDLIDDPADVRAVLHGRRMTYHYYGQMFRDVASVQPDDAVPNAA